MVGKHRNLGDRTASVQLLRRRGAASRCLAMLRASWCRVKVLAEDVEEHAAETFATRARRPLGTDRGLGGCGWSGKADGPRSCTAIAKRTVPGPHGNRGLVFVRRLSRHYAPSRRRRGPVKRLIDADIRQSSRATGPPRACGCAAPSAGELCRRGRTRPKLLT
jgi:hypothetical protein